MEQWPPWMGREEVKSNTKPEGRTEVLYKPRGGSDNFHKVISLVRQDVLHVASGGSNIHCNEPPPPKFSWGCVI